MKTPTEYKKNLDKGIVTRQMLSDCLFSVNKRAKNYRDKLREEPEYLRRAYRYSYFSYDNTEKLEAKRDEYYRMKEQLLAHISPVCIHQEPQQHRIRISSNDFENMKQFDKQYKQDLKAERIIYENSYKDWDTDEVVYISTMSMRLCQHITYIMISARDTRSMRQLTRARQRNT